MYSKNKITLETLLASRYEARSITQVSTPAKLRDERAIFPEAPPPWQLTGNNIAGRNAPRSQARWRKKTQMQTNVKCHCKLRRVAALLLMCAIVQCCWSEGSPQCQIFCFGIGSIKKNKKNHFLEEGNVFPCYVYSLVGLPSSAHYRTQYRQSL